MLEMYPRIEDWALLKGSMLEGYIYNHKQVSDGTLITTPKIIETFDNGLYTIILTDKGYVYRLGNVSDEYKQWVLENGKEFDPKNPLVFMRN